VTNPQLTRTARIFGIGAICGFVLGAAIVAVLITRYGHPRRASIGASSGSVSASDGLAAVDAPSPAERPRSTTGVSAPPVAKSSASMRAAPPSALLDRDLEIPVEGVKPEQLVRSFEDERSGTRSHEAIDILAPRNTPVKAVEDGTIAKLFESKAGGITIYQFDPAGQFCYYYAHLERYANGLQEGARVRKGQILGYVGTSGNAPKNTPHLHFAVFKLTPARHWWEGTPIDPYDILR
jgi:murein DD-endopeptidase MepM/ murein hydrolase activator NlpD